MKRQWMLIGLILNLFLTPVWAETKKDPKSSDSKEPISIEDLGFSQSDAQSDPQLQKDLEARSDMLQIHQAMGLVTAIPLTTTFILGLTTANGVSNGNSDTGLHTALGLSTVVFYGTTACFAIFAPKPKGLKPSGASEVHQALSWIHIPLMIVTPLLGDMMNDRIVNHQPLGDLPTVHGIAAGTLLASYLASMAVMTFNF